MKHSLSILPVIGFTLFGLAGCIAPAGDGSTGDGANAGESPTSSETESGHAHDRTGAPSTDRSGEDDGTEDGRDDDDDRNHGEHDDEGAGDGDSDDGDGDRDGDDDGDGDGDGDDDGDGDGDGDDDGDGGSEPDEGGCAAEPCVNDPVAECNADVAGVLLPSFPDLTLAEPIETGRLLGLLEKTLNSPGDSVTMELGIELDVPLLPGVGVGGDGSLGFRVSMDEAGGFVLESDREAAVAANLSAGLASGAGGGGVGLGVRWRFDTQAEVVAAIQRLVILRVLGPSLEAAATRLNGRVSELEQWLSDARARRRALVDRLFDSLGLSGRLLDRIRQLEDERNQFLQGLRRLEELTSWVVDARLFLREHVAGVRIELDRAVEVIAGASVFETGGDASAIVGLEARGGIERSVSIELATLSAEPGMSADVTLAFRKEVGAAGGVNVAGISVELARTLEIKGRGTLTTSGVSLDRLSPNARLVLSRAYYGSSGAQMAELYGVGRETRVALDLVALSELGSTAAGAVLAGAPGEAAEVLSRLPLELSGQARLVRGLMFGAGVEAGEDFAGGKVYAEAIWADAGDASTSTGVPCRDALVELVSGALDTTVPEEILLILDELGAQSI